MTYGICILSVVPCRVEPSDKAEIVTQLIFGDMYSTIEENEKWVKIKNAHDSYESWIDKKQHEEISEEEYKLVSSSIHPFSTGVFDILVNGNSEKIHIPLGSTLPFLKDNQIAVGKNNWLFIGEDSLTNLGIETVSKSFLNSPYLWGGRTHFGIDCSGFTQIVYKILRADLPRDAYQQAELGTNIPLNEAAKGDLAFFHNKDGKITHVGIMLNANEVIHASGKVRIDDINESGIINRDNGNLSHNFNSIKRILKQTTSF